MKRKCLLKNLRTEDGFYLDIDLNKNLQNNIRIWCLNSRKQMEYYFDETDIVKITTEQWSEDLKFETVYYDENNVKQPFDYKLLLRDVLPEVDQIVLGMSCNGYVDISKKTKAAQIEDTNDQKIKNEIIPGNEKAPKGSGGAGGEKKSSVPKLLIAIMAIAICGVGALCAYKLIDSPVKKVIQYLEDDNYKQVVKVYNEKIYGKSSKEEKVNPEIDSEIYELAEEYYIGSLGYKESIDSATILLGLKNDQLTEKVQNKIDSITQTENAKNAFNEAELYYEADDYLKAMELYSKIPEGESFYEEAQNKYEECREKEAEVEERKRIINDAVAAFENGSYEEGFSILDSGLKTFSSNSEMQQLMTEYKEKYRNQIINDAANTYESEGYEAAVLVINKGLAVLNNDSALTKEKNKYRALAPIPITELDATKRGGHLYIGVSEGKKSVYYAEEYYITELAKDVSGNSYSSNEIHYGLYRTGDNDKIDKKKELSITYFLNQEYSVLTGTLYRPYLSLSCDYDWTGGGGVEIYGDDILLYSTTMPEKTFDTVEIEVDVTGVRELRIQPTGYWSDHVNRRLMMPKSCLANLKVAKKP